MSVSYKEVMKKIIQEKENGVITSKEITELGIHRSVLKDFVQSGEIYQYRRGIYVKSDAWEDEFFLLQLKYERGIFSHETALYLLGYSDRCPCKFTMTFPQGYNCHSLKSENVIVKKALKENYELGIIEIKSPCGNMIKVYDFERTLCDCLKGQGTDVQIINPAMRKYVFSSDINILKLIKYSEQLHVKGKISKYLEVLLWLLKKPIITKHKKLII